MKSRDVKKLTNNKLLIILPIIIYLMIMLYIAYRVKRMEKRSNLNFIEEYYMGSRSMGGFVLAMTIIASYVSASSFIGGPAIAYNIGLGWVFLACIQTPTAFLTLGILGKKLAIISRKINGVTIIDYLKARYSSDIVVVSGALLTLVFFIASMIAQFIGGARLIETVTGYDYTTGLILFCLIVIIYTAFGGFRTVAITDAIQGVVMIIAAVCLFLKLYQVGGGMGNIVKNIAEINPDLLRPDSGGNLPIPYLLSFWVLVGVAILGLPQTTVRCMGFKDSKSMHNAMFIGTLVVGFLMIVTHMIGFMSIPLMPGAEVGDKLIPMVSLKYLNPILVGIFIGGPLAAIMSTIDTMLIIASSAIVKDLYFNYFSKSKKINEKKIRTISTMTTLIIGLIVFFLSLDPPKLLVYINLFAFGGLEASFLCPILFGLYWRRANSTGAVLSMLSGVVSFIYLSYKKITVFETNQIVPAILISILFFIIGSFLGKKEPEEKLKYFF